MIRFLIPLILLVITFILTRRYLRSAPVEMRASRRITVLLAGLSLVFIILTFIHRMHWIGAAITFIIFIGHLLFQSLIFDKAQKNKVSIKQQSSKISNGMNEDEAVNLLGLQKPYSKDEVMESHRKLMQKLHPDRGGNDYLATKINQAKDFLLGKI